MIRFIPHSHPIPFSTAPMATANSNKAGINLRNYESAVASILSKCNAAQQNSDYCFPLPCFPPKLSHLPPLPNENIINTINSSVPKVSAEAAVTKDHSSDKAQNTSTKKTTSRLDKKRAAKKQRAEAEKDADVQQQPCWPFDILPPPACPRAGGRLSGRRARKKEGQLSSMIRCVLAMLPHDAFGRLLDDGNTSRRIRIVDFAGGSGHLALPLALLLPRCEVVIVDLKERSLEVARERAEACGHVPNLVMYHGSISRYDEPFDIGLALHACGEATDLVLHACGRAKAAFVAAPCCVGKLMGFNPYIFQSSGENSAMVQYPQSDFFRKRLDFSSIDFDALAKAADHSEDDGESINAIKRTAKILLEADRLGATVEQYDYDRKTVALTRMEPLDASPKNDILLGWGHTSSEKGLKAPYSGEEKDIDPDPFIAKARHQLSLLSPADTNEDTSEKNICIDWTAEEENTIREQLRNIFVMPSEEGASDAQKDGNEEVFRFPTGMGSRQRRLIHLVADDMDLAHWGEGKKGKDKTVCVAVKRPSKSSAQEN